MLRATYLFVFGVIITFATLAFSQETEIDQALKISKRTGKPIFAIASRKVCVPCQQLKSRVAQYFQNKQIAEQVVYLKIDLDDPSWNKWSRKFPHQGRMLPIVYLIRADERQMYGQSNALAGGQLQKFIQQGVAHCGDSLTASQISEIEQINQTLESSIESGEIHEAIKSMQQLKKYGTPGKLNCFASVAQTNNQLVSEVAAKSIDHVQTELSTITADLEGIQEHQFRGVYKFVELRDQFGDFDELNEEFSKVAVKLAIKPELRKLWSVASTVYEANQTLAYSQDLQEKEMANSNLTAIESGDAPEIAKLAAKKVKRQHSAILASLNNDTNSK